MLEGIIVGIELLEVILVAIEMIEVIFVVEFISLSSKGQAGSCGRREHPLDWLAEHSIQVETGRRTN